EHGRRQPAPRSGIGNRHKVLLCETACVATRQRAIKARSLLRSSGVQSRGGCGSGGGDRPRKIASRTGQSMLLAGGIQRLKAATPSAGAKPTHATTQPAAVGGHGVPSQEGQCWVQSAPTLVCSVAGDPDGLHAKANAGKLAATTAKQAKRADRKRSRFILR